MSGFTDHALQLKLKLLLLLLLHMLEISSFVSRVKLSDQVSVSVCMQNSGSEVSGRSLEGAVSVKTVLRFNRLRQMIEPS